MSRCLDIWDIKSNARVMNDPSAIWGKVIPWVSRDVLHIINDPEMGRFNGFCSKKELNFDCFDRSISVWTGSIRDVVLLPSFLKWNLCWPAIWMLSQLMNSSERDRTIRSLISVGSMGSKNINALVFRHIATSDLTAVVTGIFVLWQRPSS